MIHLVHNTANRPDVDWGRVDPLPQENLRRPIPQSDHFWRVLLCQLRHFPREPKIRNLKPQPLIKQKILRLEIPVNDPISMAFVNPREEIPHKNLDLQ